MPVPTQVVKQSTRQVVDIDWLSDGTGELVNAFTYLFYDLTSSMFGIYGSVI